MANFQIIRLLESELGIALRLTEDVVGEDAATAEQLTELLLDRRNIVLAALQEETSVGYLVAHKFPSLSGHRLVYLYDIEVKVEKRRLGIGTALVAKLKEVCRAQAVDSIWVGSSRDNHAACALWASTGAVQESDQYAEFTYEL
jgi:ribosomal protein S18 acetylase RimI-like enzyme